MTITIACACGSVQYEARGDPITTAICYCDDCQLAAREIEALPGAPAILDADGGTMLSLFRKDRLGCVQGSEHLTPRKLKTESITNRYVATCCNSLIHLGFDKGPHWVSVWTERIAPPRPSVERRVMTRYSPNEAKLPNDVPKASGFSFGFLLTMLVSRLQMLIKK